MPDFAEGLLDKPRRVWLLLVLAAVLPILLLGGLVAYQFASRARAYAWQVASDRAAHVADRAAAEVATQIAVAETLAASSALDSGDLRAFYLEATRVQALHPLWFTIELTTPAGLQVLNLLRQPGGTLPPTADRDSFNRVLQTQRPAVGGIGPVGLLSGRRLVMLRVPVVRSGELRYVLSAAVAPDTLSQILRDAGIPHNWIGAIVDAGGYIVARTRDEGRDLGQPASAGTRQAIGRATSGSYTTDTLEGVEVETVFYSLPNTDGWTVHFGIPKEELQAPVRWSLYLLAAGSCIALLLASALITFVARALAQRRHDERERAERALRVSEEGRAVAVEAADLGTWRWDIETNVFDGSDRCVTLLGLRRGEADSKIWQWEDVLKAVDPQDRLNVDAGARWCVDHGDRFEVEFRVSHGNGNIRWVRATGRGGGSTLRQRLQGVIADVTALKQIEAERVSLQRRLAQAQEDERRRIARELHDQVGQTVTGLSLGLAALEASLGPMNECTAIRERMRWLKSLTAEIGRDIHRAASDLRPAALDDLGLHKALLAHAAEWSDRFGIAVQVVGRSDRLSLEMETVVYRVVQEAMTNVLKHATASNVSILLDRRSDQIRIIIEDDGKGFEPDQVDSSETHLGLSGIRERLALVGGHMTLESAPGSGTTLFIQIPVSPVAAVAPL